MNKNNQENTEIMIEKKNQLSEKYNHQEIEPKWQKYWLKEEIYHWKNDKNRDETFVIDTPPPTVSGMLHMGHIFSYSQADFVARFQRMLGKDVFYPMGFDDNGLPTERLVEKIINKKANIFEQENGRGSFVKKCQEVVVDAEKEFKELFNNIALSVDWRQKYQTISPESQKISQASFVDLCNKGLVERRSAPVLWDCVDRTALSQADLVDREMPSSMHEIIFEVEGSDQPITIATTRPELLPACVAVMVNNNDQSYEHLFKDIEFGQQGFTGHYAITALFGVKVPIIADDLVQTEKGTGAVMCCTFGDETDIKWWQKHNLPLRVLLQKDGRLRSAERVINDNTSYDIVYFKANDKSDINNNPSIKSEDIKNPNDFVKHYNECLAGKKIKEARDEIIKILGIKNLSEKKLLIKSTPITHSVKCGERSGAPIEILTMPQWFIKILDKKEQLKAQAGKCKWHPDYMKIRIEQWIDGLAWDWCISRQRFFGVKFPVWRVVKDLPLSEGGEMYEVRTIVAEIDELPVDPMATPPKGYIKTSDFQEYLVGDGGHYFAEKDGVRYRIMPETDIMDTWATSSISPQLSSKGISDEICFDKQRHEKLFPADLRPQAHEIIRTWAFYTIAKAYLHSLPNKNDPSQQSQIATPSQEKGDKSVPWKNLMISGWCLASDKTKMSKSKGNIITPASLIKEKGSDAVRYWASTSHLGADTAYSEEVFKIGQKLITKLFNSAKFCSMNFHLLKDDAEICEGFDHWILGKLNQAIENSKKEFLKFEYAKAREIIEEFFWHYFCDNYLEICKVRSYGLNAEKIANNNLNEAEKELIVKKQQSAIKTLQICLNAILKLFAPFIPHICEEIYSIVFEKEFINKKSIHSRGNIALIEENIAIETNFIALGDKALEIIFEVRKWKSERNLSMKTTINNLTIINNQNIYPIEADLANVCNALNVDYKNDENNHLIEINN